jgi:choline transport protein
MNNNFSQFSRKLEGSKQGLNIPFKRSEDNSSNPASPHREFAQKLDRLINFIPAIAFVSTSQASWESVSASFQAGLINGGHTSLVYGQLIAWFGSLAIALSISEMASINPTVGAQYRWTALYAPPELMSPAFWGLLQGWIIVFALISTPASAVFLVGTMIQGLLVFFNPDYDYERWHGSLLAIAILCIPLVSSPLFVHKCSILRHGFEYLNVFWMNSHTGPC